MAETQCNLVDDDNPLTESTRSPWGMGQPHLRIVHSAERFPEPEGAAPSAAMPTPDRGGQSSGTWAALRASDRPPAMLDRMVQAQIGHMLRDSFAGVAGEPVPERFITLLAELEAKEKFR
jgi:hypothetical protein